MAENVILTKNVRLRAADGTQLFPETSADVVLHLSERIAEEVSVVLTQTAPDAVTATIAGNEVTVKGEGIGVQCDGNTILIKTSAAPASDVVVSAIAGAGLEENSGKLKVKLHRDESAKGWLEYGDDGSIRPGLLYEEI